ncbi:MAG: hypothetical protein M3405_08985 [Acidobacteriota bacterium]|nr:hypothetical protein [Acidobacteriota bacterium]
MKKTQFFLLLLLTMFLIASCGTKSGLTEKQDEIAKDAIEELNKISAATEIGINKIEYSKMLIDAKSKVNQVSQDLPDGELKQKIEEAMENYIDAYILWDELDELKSQDIQSLIVCLDQQNPEKEDLNESPLGKVADTFGRLICNPVAKGIVIKYKEIPVRDFDGKITDKADIRFNLNKKEGISFIWFQATKNIKNATSLLE